MSLLDGLVSHWKLDEESGTRYDSHGANHLADDGAGIGSPGPVGFTSGQLGNAADFTEDNQNLYTAANFQAGDGFTLGMWLKIPALSPDDDVKIWQHDAVDSMYLRFYRQAGEPSDLIQVYLAGNVGSSYVTYAIPGADWFLLTAWYDATDGAIHALLNNADPGAVYGEGTTFDPQVAAGGLELGPVYTNQFAPYALDSPSFWQRVLTADERTTLWNDGAGLDYPFTPPVTRRTGHRDYYWQRYDREGQIAVERKLVAEMDAARRAVWQKPLK